MSTGKTQDSKSYAAGTSRRDVLRNIAGLGAIASIDGTRNSLPAQGRSEGMLINLARKDGSDSHGVLLYPPRRITGNLQFQISPNNQVTTLELYFNAQNASLKAVGLNLDSFIEAPTSFVVQATSIDTNGVISSFKLSATPTFVTPNPPSTSLIGMTLLTGYQMGCEMCVFKDRWGIGIPQSPIYPTDGVQQTLNAVYGDNIGVTIILALVSNTIEMAIINLSQAQANSQLGTQPDPTGPVSVIEQFQTTGPTTQFSSASSSQVANWSNAAEWIVPS